MNARLRKKDLELQLSEKEINFLVLFSKSKKSISRKLILKSVWKYSSRNVKPIPSKHIFIDLEKRLWKNLMITHFIKNNHEGVLYLKKKLRNFIARDLFSPKYKKRIVKSKKGKGKF